jgi:hypothetical protein
LRSIRLAIIRNRLAGGVIPLSFEVALIDESKFLATPATWIKTAG